MKKRFFSLFVCAVLLLSIIAPAHTAWADTSSGDGTIYTDPETGVTFVVPGNWEERELDSDSSKSFHAKFHSLEDSRDLFLYGYLDVWNEMPASERERSGHTRSDVDTSYFYSKETLRELFVTLLAQSDFAVAADDVQLVRCGKNEYVEIAFVREVGSRTVTFISSMYIENGYGYFFTFGAASDAAIEDYRSVLSSMQVPSSGESGVEGSNTYTDPLSGVTFVLPEGWNELQLNIELPYPFQVQFASQKNLGSTFAYGSVDAWSELTASERSGLTRSDIDTAYTYAYEDGAFIEYMAQSIIQGASDVQSNAEVNDIGLVTYGENSVIEVSFSQEISGACVPLTAVLYVENGYMHLFWFAGSDNQATRDFHSVLSSLQAPGSGGTGSGQSDEAVEKIMVHLVNFVLFFVELGVTFLIYALPFVVYRNAIRKRPVNEKALVLILVVLYEFVAWLLLNGAMSWFLRRYANIFIPFIWGWYSYRKMVRRKDPDDLPEDTGGSAAPQQPVKAALSPQPAAAPEPPALSAISAAPVTPQSPPATPAAPVSSAPAAYIPAEPIPAAPAPQASPATPVSPAPAAPVSQAPSFPELGTPASPARQTPPAAPRIQFCRNCGFRLLDDSKFCSVCGTPVVSITNPVSGGELP